MRTPLTILVIFLSFRGFCQSDTAVTAYIDTGPEYIYGDQRLRMDLLTGVTAAFPVGVEALSLSFVVNKDGTVRDPLIDWPASEKLKEELSASILKLRAFRPAKKDGKPVNYRQVLWLS